jgi:hypothetical protein
MSHLPSVRYSILALAVVLGLGFSVALALETEDWRGIIWGEVYGSASVNASDELEVVTSTCTWPPSCWGAPHYNTPGPLRATSTPWVRVTFIDDGYGSAGAQLWMEMEGVVGQPDPPGAAWTQIGAWQVQGRLHYWIRWWNVNDDVAGWRNTGILRTPGEHEIVLAKRADGAVDYWLDSSLVFSTTAIAPRYFGDIYL